MQVTRRQPFIFEDVDTLLLMSEVEDVLRKSRVLKSVPTRPTLIEYCDDGTFESVIFRGKYLVYESSVLKFIEQLQRPHLKAA